MYGDGGEGRSRERRRENLPIHDMTPFTIEEKLAQLEVANDEVSLGFRV